MNTKNTLPKWIDTIIDNLSPPHFVEEIKGDLLELFTKDVNERGLKHAKRKYVVNSIGFLVRSFFWKKNSTIYNNTIMLSSYFKMARRSLLSYKSNTIINVLGLVIGIASSLVILTVLRYELSFDSFHSDADRIYRLVRVSGENMDEFRTGISYPVPQTLKDEVPSIEKITAIDFLGGAFVEVLDTSGNSVKKFQIEGGCAMIDTSFFKVLDFKNTNFKWIAGNPEKALTEPFNVVLTRSEAKKLFGDDDALGQTLRFERQADCKVTGVIEDLPPNTDLPFKMMVSYATLPIMIGKRMENWYSVNDSHHTYVKLAAGKSKDDVNKEIAKVHEAHTSKDLHDRHYLLQSLDEVHQDPRYGNYNGRTITQQTIMALGLIALFLLVTASINYINLATAQSTMRSKEIGLRKVMGSNRKNLIMQFLTETFLVVLTATLIAVGLAEIMLQNLQSLLNLNLSGYTFTDPMVLLSMVAIVVGVTLFAGIYPSLIISRFNPITALKNKFSTEAVGGMSLRKVLVVVQFSITQILVVGTFIVVSQIKFFQNKNMGFNKEAVVILPVPDRTLGKKIVVKDQLLSQAFISNVSYSATLPSGVNRSRSFMDIQRSENLDVHNPLVFEYNAVDPAYLDLYQIKLLAGRNLTLQDSSVTLPDSSRSILINRTLAKNLGFETTEAALHHTLKMGGDKTTVVGVIEDYYSNSLKEGVDNIVLTINTNASGTLSIKLNMNNGERKFSEAIAAIEKTWTTMYPEYIFSYQFFDENIKNFYLQEQKYAKLFQLFSLIFMLIGCLGLYGLITFVVNGKGKEVAIRKVLGANVKSILFLFSKEYVQLILISFVIAVPIAYYAVTNWLSNFQNKIELHWWLFVIPGIIVLVIALCVVTIKSMQAALANPVDNLKYE